MFAQFLIAQSTWVFSLRNGNARKLCHCLSRGNETIIKHPISIIPVVAKIFESIIHDQVNVFFNDNGLLSNSQSGFRRFHFTATALLEATNEWAYNIDCGNVGAVVFFDPKKAFDTVDHGILLSKLDAYGIQEVLQAIGLNPI